MNDDIPTLDRHGEVNLSNLAECSQCHCPLWHAIFAIEPADGSVTLEVLRCASCRAEVRPYHHRPPDN